MSDLQAKYLSRAMHIVSVARRKRSHDIVILQSYAKLNRVPSRATFRQSIQPEHYIARLKDLKEKDLKENSSPGGRVLLEYVLSAHSHHYTRRL